MCGGWSCTVKLMDEPAFEHFCPEYTSQSEDQTSRFPVLQKKIDDWYASGQTVERWLDKVSRNSEIQECLEPPRSPAVKSRGSHRSSCCLDSLNSPPLKTPLRYLTHRRVAWHKEHCVGETRQSIDLCGVRWILCLRSKLSRVAAVTYRHHFKCQ